MFQPADDWKPAFDTVDTVKQSVNEQNIESEIPVRLPNTVNSNKYANENLAYKKEANDHELETVL